MGGRNPAERASDPRIAGTASEAPHVALVILAAGNTASTARGPASVVDEPMTAARDHSAVAIDVEQVDDHPQPAFGIEAGVDRPWTDKAERDALGSRVRALTELASP